MMSALNCTRARNQLSGFKLLRMSTSLPPDRVRFGGCEFGKTMNAWKCGATTAAKLAACNTQVNDREHNCVCIFAAVGVLK
jgi:hypothetical protein